MVLPLIELLQDWTHVASGLVSVRNRSEDPMIDWYFHRKY